MKKLLCGLFAVAAPPAIGTLVIAGGYWIDQNRELVGYTMVGASILAVWGIASYAVYRGTQL